MPGDGARWRAGSLQALRRMPSYSRRILTAVATVLLAAGGLDAQEMRVLLIGAHPDDEDTNLIAWLQRGGHAHTAYLSLTRGDGGQNLIGNELGEELGIIRTEELLAARRVDGAHQFFTRAYDFGFSKSAAETYAHWPKASLLNDVVTVVRAWRPHIIITMFSGTPRDGHGQHQVSAILGKEAYAVASDTVRFPVRDFGPAWTPQKLYQTARFQPDSATLRFNVGEYDPELRKSYAEIAGESRSQHKSQGFGALQRGLFAAFGFGGHGCGLLSGARMALAGGRAGVVPDRAARGVSRDRDAGGGCGGPGFRRG